MHFLKSHADTPVSVHIKKIILFSIFCRNDFYHESYSYLFITLNYEDIAWRVIVVADKLSHLGLFHKMALIWNDYLLFSLFSVLFLLDALFFSAVCR